MCLTLRKQQRRDESGYPIPSIARQDIVCYKWLEKRFNYYVTPFQGVKVKIGQVMEAELGTSMYSVYEGIHAFQTFKRGNRSMDYPEDILVKCIIPKGAQYIQGYDKHIVTTKLKLQKIVVKFVKDKKVILEEPLKKNKK